MVLNLKKDNLKQAIKWISEQKISNSSKSKYRLIEKASIKFNLNPIKTEFLLRKL